MITTIGSPIIAAGIEFGYTDRQKLYARVTNAQDGMALKVLEFLTGRADLQLEYEGTARVWVSDFGGTEDKRLASIIDQLIKLREANPAGRQLSFLSEPGKAE